MDEVVERVQNSDSEDGVSENDDSEDDFDGYLKEMDIDGWWNRREMDSNSDEEGSSDDRVTVTKIWITIWITVMRI